MTPAGDPGWLAWLEATTAATAMRQLLWLYPIVEILHIIGFVVLVGSAAMFDLRLLGLSRQLARPIGDWPRQRAEMARRQLLRYIARSGRLLPEVPSLEAFLGRELPPITVVDQTDQPWFERSPVR